MMYLLKFLLASTLLYGIYYFLLRNETTFKFNRFYLLSILAVAAIIPLVIVKTTIVEVVAVAETPVVESTYQVNTDSFPLEDTAYSSPLEETEQLETSVQINWPLVGKATYGTIALLLLLRFFLNLRSIYLLRKTGEEITFKSLPLIQSSKVKTTFSFLNKVFVNSTLFKQQGLADEILEHEAVHIKQKHSLDIIFMELVACFIWFNPVVYFIRRNIKLNHEYLADAGVLKHSKDPNAYQMLLLKHSSKQLILNPLLASHLSYGETKQRFKIMFKTTNKRVAALKQLTALALITGLFFAMGEERVIAQDQETASEQKVSFDVPPPPPPVKFRLTSKTKIRFEYANGDVVKGEYGKLNGRNKEIFESPEGKGEVFIPRVTYLRIPDQEMLDKYADANKYRVWIDGKEIVANELSSYNPKDFNDYYITPFGESEKEFGKLSSKVEFRTPDYKREKEAKLPNGTWASYVESMKPEDIKRPQIKEVKQETTKKQKVGAKITGRVIDPKNQKVRFINSKGEKVEKKYEDLTPTEKARFDQPEAKGEIFLPPPPPAYISDEMMKEFQNPKEYGVWLDGKRVENSVLANYSANDFHHYFKSRLLKNASHYGRYTYQLGLYSLSEWEKDPNSKGSWIKHKVPKKIKTKEKDKQTAKVIEVREVKRPIEVVEVVEEERAPEVREIKEEIQPIEVIEIKEEKQPREVIEVREEERPIKVIEVKEEKQEQPASLTRKSEKLVNEDFQIRIIDIDKTSVTMECDNCGWRKFLIETQEGVPQILDNWGIVKPDRLEESESAFMFSFTPSSTGLSFESIRGTAWKTLSFDRKPFRTAYLDKSGISWIKKSKTKEKPGQPLEEEPQDFVGRNNFKKGDHIPPELLAKLDIQKVDFLIAPTKSALLKYETKNGEILKKTYGNMTDEEFYDWLDPDRKGMIFSPPTKRGLSLIKLNEFRTNNKFDIIIDNQKTTNDVLYDYYPNSFYDYEIEDLGKDKFQVKLTTHRRFLSAEHDETAWMSRVIYKD